MPSDTLRDPSRLAAVRATGLLDTPPEPEFDRLTRVAARAMNAPISLLTLVEDTRQFFKSSVGVEGRETDIDASLCRFVATRAAPLIVQDAASDHRFVTHPAHTVHRIRAYLGIPVRSLSGQVVGSFCVADRLPRSWSREDIGMLTDLAADAEAEVQRREQRQNVSAERDLLIEVMRSSAAAVVVLNPQGRIIYCNDNAERILGVRASDAEKRTYDAPSWQHTTLDGRPFPDDEQPFRRVMRTGQPVTDIRHAIVWPDGQRRALSVNGSPVKDGTGKIVRLVFHVHDITESLAAQEALQRSEEKFSRAFAASPDAIALSLLPDGRLVEVNRGFCEMFSLTPAECLGRTALELGLWESAEKRAEVLGRIQTEGRLRDHEVQWVTRTGRHLTCLLSCEKFEAGGQSYIVAIARDVTALRAATEAETHYRRQMLQNQKIEALGTLAGGIAHDFNNLLAGILGHAEFGVHLAKDVDTMRDNFRDIHRIGLRARDLVRRILAFSRAQEMQRTPTSLTGLVREHLGLLRSALPATVELVAELPEEDLTIEADAAQLHQVLLNLATNGAYAMKHRGRLELTLARTEIDADWARLHPPLQPGPGARLSVRDHGSGMSPEAMTHLFEPFFTTKPPGEGTGLGLATVHGLMRAHHGAVTVEPAPGGGTTFHLYFPLIPGQAEAMGSGEKAPVRSGEGEKVMFIDDEEHVSRVAERVLRFLGYTPVIHSDPLAAIADFTRRPQEFQLVITDYTMPGCTGDEVVRRVLAIRPDLPVIVCSGYAANFDLAAAQALGARTMLDKPFSIEALGAAIRECLGTPPK